MDQRTWKILLVEDDEDDYILARDMLREARGETFTLQWCATYPAALEALHQALFDAVIVDYHLGAYRGVDLPVEAAIQGSQTAFILLTGQGSYEVDLQATHAGFADFLVKSEVTPWTLERSIRYAIEHQRLVHEVESQKSLLEAIFQTDPGGLAVVMGPELRFQFANSAYQAITPNPEQDPVGRTFREVWPDEDGAKREEAIRRLLANGEPAENIQAKSYHPDGRLHIYSIHMRCMEWNGQPAVLSILWDVTDLEEARQQAVRLAEEAHQRASEAEEGKRILQALMDYIPEGLTIAEAPDSLVRMTSRYGLRLLEPVGGLDGKPLVEGVPEIQVYYPDGQTLVDPTKYPLNRAINKGEVVENEEIIMAVPGKPALPLLCNAGPIRDKSGTIIGGVIAWRDITDRKVAEAQMLETEAHIEAQHHLLQYREKERLQIARDLHDGPIQELIAATFTLQGLMSDDTTEAIKPDLQEIQDRVQGQVRELRAICNDLRPPALAPFGLEKALTSHLEEFRQAHPEIQLVARLDEDGQALSADVRLALYRITQELLNNVVRHAQASRVEVAFHLSSEKAVVSVKDNGRGFNLPHQWVELSRQGHFGLVGIEERASAVGGQVQICSRPGEGACIEVTVPVTSS